ncbi:PAS domain S-box protein, partial [candidate division KSB3 bacterium]|nr:PAS domain S-box protein [candidate division KSB3 bacterium]MBD3324553.1 PAS domain S-box protein [candidate division KSB3 bacterium]
MKSSSLSLATKIWLSLGILVMGYLVSMVLGLYFQQQAETRLNTVASVFVPASTQSLLAFTAFNEQIKLYNDAVLTMEPLFIELAQHEAVKSRKALQFLLNLEGINPQKRTEIEQTFQRLTEFTATAQEIYQQICAQRQNIANAPRTPSATESVEIIPDEAWQLDQMTQVLREKLEGLVDTFVADLQQELMAVNDSQRREQYLNLIIFSGVVISSLSLFSIIIRRSLILPLLRLGTIAEKITAGQETDIKWLPDSQDEIGALNTALRSMTQNLQAEIQERKRTEESMLSLQQAVETMQIGITITDLDGKIIYTNPADAEMHGYTVDELIGQPVELFSPSGKRQSVTLKQIRRWRGLVRESFNRRKDNTLFPVWLTSEIVKDAQGEPFALVTSCEDITDRKHAEEELTHYREHLEELVAARTADLKQTNEHLRQEIQERQRIEDELRKLSRAVEQSASVILITDLNGTIEFVNPAFSKTTGYSMKEAIGKLPSILRSGKHSPEFYQDLWDTVKRGEVWQGEFVNRKKSGDLYWESATISPVRDHHGKITHYLAVKDDITERKQTEAMLLRQANLLRGVAEAMNELLVKTDFQLAITQALEILGRSIDFDRIYIYQSHQHPETGAPLMSQRVRWEQNLPEVRIDDPEFQDLSYASLGISRWYQELRAHHVLSGLMQEFPPSEQPLLESTGILSTIVLPIMIRERLWGFIGFDDCQTYRRWKEEEESILVALAGSIGGAIARQEAETKLIDANEELKSTLDDLTRTQAQLVQSEKMAALGQLIAGIAHEINTPLGAIRSSVGTIGRSLKQVLNELPQFLDTLPLDRRRDFFTLLQKALHKKQLLSSKEERRVKRELVKTLKAYHLDNARKIADMVIDIGIQESIEAFVPLLRDPHHFDILQMVYQIAGLQDSTATIMHATERASKVVFALKSYAHSDYAGDLIETDIIESLETVLTLYYNQIKRGVEVVRTYQDVEPLLCYSDELNQVWTNLIHNALQAMEYQGALEIGVGQDRRPRAGMPSGAVWVAITDSGRGIPPEIRNRIFEPFFTTKPPGEGSGLGLDIVKKIIEKHHGEISVESIPGKTTFRVVLPF